MFQYYSGRNPPLLVTIVMTVNELWLLNTKTERMKLHSQSEHKTVMAVSCSELERRADERKVLMC